MHRWGHFGKLSASLGTLRQAQCIAGDTSASSVHRWGHFGKLSASLGTLRQAQCIAGDTSASSVHRWGLGTGLQV
ncbi:MAG: hypothetical protein HEQ35_18435 [Gloeotrichia echinulata IR180]|nr:hypothetical protein [Gloeotrichia echinulata DEX184]